MAINYPPHRGPTRHAIELRRNGHRPPSPVSEEPVRLGCGLLEIVGFILIVLLVFGIAHERNHNCCTLRRDPAHA
jgi:hypothetical protein